MGAGTVELYGHSDVVEAKCDSKYRAYHLLCFSAISITHFTDVLYRLEHPSFSKHLEALASHAFFDQFRSPEYQVASLLQRRPGPSPSVESSSKTHVKMLNASVVRSHATPNLDLHIHPLDLLSLQVVLYTLKRPLSETMTSVFSWAI